MVGLILFGVIANETGDFDASYLFIALLPQRRMNMVLLEVSINVHENVPFKANKSGPNKRNQTLMQKKNHPLPSSMDDNNPVEK